MFVDLNREADHQGVVPHQSYGAAVPRNVYLAKTDKAARIARFHEPYWDAVRRDVADRLRSAGACLHLSSHSFSPELDPAQRTYDVGVLYDPEHEFEAELANRLLVVLRAAGLDVRANQPYTGGGAAICASLRRELTGQRYAGIQLETSHAVTYRATGCSQIARAVQPFLAELRAG